MGWSLHRWQHSYIMACLSKDSRAACLGMRAGGERKPRSEQWHQGEEREPQQGEGWGPSEQEAGAFSLERSQETMMPWRHRDSRPPDFHPLF